MLRRILVAVFLPLMAVPAVAQPPVPARPPCLQQINIWDYQPVAGNRAMIVTDRGRVRYRLTFLNTCYNLQHHLGVAFKTFGTSNLSCVAKGDQVLFRDVATPGRCIVKDVQYQTPEMDKADAAAKAAR